GLLACAFLVTLGATVIAAGDTRGGVGMMGMWMVGAGFGVLFWGLLPTLDRYPPASPEGVRRHRRVSRTVLGFAALEPLYLLSGLPIPPGAHWLATLTFAALFAATVAAAILVTRAPRLASSLLTIVAVIQILHIGAMAMRLSDGAMMAGPVTAVPCVLMIAATSATVLARWSIRRAH
ncbi:MAG TPA: hypothetical protein VF625_04055, partial [Longimicrobium sp.]